MKKILRIFLICFVLYFVFSSIFDNTCRLDGCERKGEGWKYYETHQTGVFGGCIGFCRMSDTGGYCSKDHAMKGR